MALSDDFLKAIGRISVNFQALETHIAFITWGLRGPDQGVGQIVTSQVSFSRLCDLCSSLFRYKTQDPNVIDELEHILRRAAEVEQQRNTIIHSIWLTDEEDAVKSPTRLKQTARRKKGLDVQSQDIDAAAHRKVDAIRDVANEIPLFIGKLQAKGYVIKTGVS